MIKRLKQWQRWSKHNTNGTLYKLAVLIGIIRSPYWDCYQDAEREWASLAKGLKRHARSNRTTGGD